MSLLRSRPRVLIVGAGPVGMATGFLLEKLFNVPTRIIDRQQGPTTHPQAHFLSLRTMEVLYTSMPQFHQALLEHAAPSHLWRDYVYCSGMGREREIARIDQFGPDIPRDCESSQSSAKGLRSALDKISPSQFLHFPQHRFEMLLNDFLSEQNISVERGIELRGLKIPSGPKNGLDPITVDLYHSNKREMEMSEYDYVIAADGAHSAVRQQCDIDMVGAEGLQSIANIHFKSPQLSKKATENPAMLYFVFNSEVIGVLIAHDLNKGEWVFQVPFFPPQESLGLDFSPRRCHRILSSLLSSLNLSDLEILSIGQWQMNAQVAKEYSDRSNRVFLVGDAAHQFPPAGGFGMNTGIQDAFSLAWRLGYSLSNPEERTTALEGYEKERQMIAATTTQVSLRNFERTMRVPTALNVSHGTAKTLHGAINSSVLSFAPDIFKRGVLQSAMTIGKYPLKLLESNNGNAASEGMKQKVKEVVEDRAGLGMLFYDFDIGYSYRKDWKQEAKKLMSDKKLNTSERFNVNKPDVYSPTVAIGKRFPHFWLQTTEEKETSTLELPFKSSGGVGFVLVVDGAMDLIEIISELPEASSELSNWVQVVRVHKQQSDEQAADEGGVKSYKISPKSIDNGSTNAWEKFLSAHKAALIRPDGHVGAMWSSNASPLTTTELSTAVLRSIQLD